MRSRTVQNVPSGADVAVSDVTAAPPLLFFASAEALLLFLEALLLFAHM
jgi:hypothetical protein